MPVTKPVFNDETGKRAAALLWVGRVVVAVCGVLCAALALTMTTRIALPGFDRLVSPTLNQSRPEIKLAEQGNTVSGADQPTTEQATDSIEPTAKPTPRVSGARAETTPAFKMTGRGSTSPTKTSSVNRTSSARPRAVEAKASPARQGSGSTASQGRGFGKTGHPTANPKKP